MNSCLPQGNCLEEGIIYNAKVQVDGSMNSKLIWVQMRMSLNFAGTPIEIYLSTRRTVTSLVKHVWELKDKETGSFKYHEIS